MGGPSPSFLRRAGDVAIPLLVGVFLVLVVGEEIQEDDSGWLRLGHLAAVACGVALIWRRSHPVHVMGATLVGSAVIHAIAPEVTFSFAALVALGYLAAARPPRVSVPALLAVLAITASGFFTIKAEDAGFAMAISIVPWALGEAARSRRAAIGEERRRAVADEQARIARELHDVIAHSVSVIVVQAGAAGAVFDERPDQARRALSDIEEAGRDALRELRLLLAGVRPGAKDGPERPQPGLARLDELTEPLRAAGLEVAVRYEGDPVDVPAGVDLSAYRIVQEALTNTLRHARATRADVTIRRGTDAVEVEVRDDGRGQGDATSAGGGHGLIGMRERATLVGGRLEAGPHAAGGYVVRASLPLETAA